MQIKVTLDEVNYKYLRATAKMNRRTLSAELNTILDRLYSKSKTDKIVEDAIKEEEITPPILTPKKKKKKSIIDGPEVVSTPTPTIEEFIKFLDAEEISPNDTSLDLFDGIKKQIYKHLDFDVFCDAQEQRQNRRG